VKSDLRRLAPATGLGVVFALLIGCGGEKPPTLVAVTGKVSFKGSPVTGGSIIFYPDAGNSYQKDKPSSLLQVDGAFTMKTFPFGDGVAPGNYKVTLAPEVASRLKMPRYADPGKTPWSIEVPATGVDDKQFEVK
jgi:hypothetical protein